MQSAALCALDDPQGSCGFDQINAWVRVVSVFTVIQTSRIILHGFSLQSSSPTFP